MFVPFTPQHRDGAGEPLVCLHGFLDTWRTWELILPAIERDHDVLALTLAGHAGGPPLGYEIDADTLADDVECRMDDAGIADAHVVGNSLGGWIALQLATRGRARSVVALAPAGGWDVGGLSPIRLLDAQLNGWTAQYRAPLPSSRAFASLEGRRRALALVVERADHVPAALAEHLVAGAAACTGAKRLIEHARLNGWPLDPERITCPVRVIWGAADALLPWPAAATRYSRDWLPHADWIVLDDVGHCPQLDVPTETAQLILGLTAR